MSLLNCKVSKKELDFIKEDAVSKLTKHAIFILGCPACGKSTIKSLYVKSLGKDINEFVQNDSDKIMLNLKSFNKIINNKKNRKTHLEYKIASQLCYKSSYDVSTSLYEFAINNNNNIILDGTGKDFIWMSNEMKTLHSKGYKIYICIVILGIDEALKRASIREAKIGRCVPKSVISDIHSMIIANIPKYIRLPFLTDITIYNNSGTKPIRINHNKPNFIANLHKFTKHTKRTSLPNKNNNNKTLIQKLKCSITKK